MDEATAYQWAAQALRGLEGKAPSEDLQTAMDRVASAVLEAARGEHENPTLLEAIIMRLHDLTLEELRGSIWRVNACVKDACIDRLLREVPGLTMEEAEHRWADCFDEDMGIAPDFWRA